MEDPTERRPSGAEGSAGLDDSADGATDALDPGALAAISDRLPVPLVVFDRSGAVRHANEPFEETFGYDPHGLSIGTVCPDLRIPSIDSDSGTAGSRADPSAGTREQRARTADGTELWVHLDVERVRGADGHWFVATVHDVTDLRHRVRDLDRYERIVETIDDGVYILDDAFNIISVNDAVSELTGYSRSELVGANASLLASEQTIERAAVVSEALLAGDADAATITTTLETADGDELPVETRFSVYEFDDGSYGQVGVVRDISERIRYERTLTALHDAARELLHAETPSAVCEHIASTATNVLDLSAAAVYLFDDDATVLRPTATAVDCETSGDLPDVGADGGDLWEAFATGERRVDTSGPPLRPDGDVELAAECGLSIPLGEHGVFFVAMGTDDRLDPDTIELTDLVAASAEAALERVDREVRLRERDAELRERNERLRRLQGINEVIRRVDGAMVGAESREGIEAAVCDELVRSDLFSFAWVGHVEDGSVVPHAWAGDDAQYLDEIDRSLAEGGPPAVRTVRTGEATLVPSVASAIQRDPWRREAVSRDFQSAISVPLSHDDVTHGVLTVYGPRSEDFTEEMASVFVELGETIANALRVVETKQWLSAESVVELDLAIEAPTCPLAVVANETGATLVHEGTIPTEAGVNHTFLTVREAAFHAVREAAERQAVVRDVSRRSPADADGDPVVEMHVATQTVATTVTAQGSRIRRLTVRPDGVDATVEVPPTANVRDLVEGLEATYASASLEARRDRASPRSVDDFRVSAEDMLTDRQWQLLRAAYLSGFFDWPRSTTGEEIADTFDVSQPTVNRHLRVGERKLLELLFDE